MNSSAEILLTGGTGLVGIRLSLLLSENYSNIRSLTRNNNISPAVNINPVKFDMASYTRRELSSVVGNADIIIHNAASLKTGNLSSEIPEIKKINIEFTKDLLETAAEKNVRKVVFTSTLSTVKKPLPELITESSELQFYSYYSESKYIGEQLIQEYAGKFGFDFSILRLSSPVSFDLKLMPDTVVKKWIVQSANKQNILVYGQGSRTQDFVHVHDVANAFLNCTQKENVNGIFNIASGTTISMLELAKLITKKFNTRYECLGEDINENDRWNISIEKAGKYLGYEPAYTAKEIFTSMLKYIEI